MNECDSPPQPEQGFLAPRFPAFLAGREGRAEVVVAAEAVSGCSVLDRFGGLPDVASVSELCRFLPFFAFAFFGFFGLVLVSDSASSSNVTSAVKPDRVAFGLAMRSADPCFFLSQHCLIRALTDA